MIEKIIKFVKERYLSIIGVLLILYIFICDFIVTFSVILNLVFIFGAILLIAYDYIKNKPIDIKEREPSFIHIFIHTSTYMYFGVMLFVILFNVLYPKKSLKDPKEYDYIIVFGAGVASGKNELMNSRIDEAIRFAQDNKKCVFVLTGAKGENEPISEAMYMFDYMTTRGISEKRVIVEPFSVNTYENVKNSLKLIESDVVKRNRKQHLITRPFNKNSEKFDLDFLNIGFMSNGFHLTRINMMARKQGIRNPLSVKCRFNPFYLPYLYVRETFSLYKALVLGQLGL